MPPNAKMADTQKGQKSAENKRITKAKIRIKKLNSIYNALLRSK